MKDLPKVSAFPINKDLKNSQDRFYGSEKNDFDFLGSNKPVNVHNKINNIFAASNHIYKSRVKIKTAHDILEKTIIGRNNDSLFTLTGEKIKIADILDIERI